jgi:hypothetical protein
VPLAADIHAVFDRTPDIEISGAISEPRMVVQMTHAQAQAVQRWLQALHDDLKYDNERRLQCLMCISRVAVAIMLSEH